MSAPRWTGPLLRLAVALTPETLRERYREEWHADLAGAAEAGASPGAVVRGALVASLRLAGAPSPTLDAVAARAWVRRDVLAWLLGGVAAATFGWMALAAGPLTASWLPVLLLGVVIAAAVATGTLRSARLGRGIWIGVLFGGLATAALVGAASLYGQILVLPLTLMGPATVLVLLVVLAARTQARPGRRPVGRAVAAGLAVTVMVAVSVVEGLVLLPRTLAPGWPLPALYAELDRVGEGAGHVLVLVWAATWLLVAAALAVLVVRRRSSSRATRTLAGGAIALLVATQPGSTFALGMSIADGLGTNGGMSALTPFLAVVGAAAACLGVVGALGPRRPDSVTAPAW